MKIETVTMVKKDVIGFAGNREEAVDIRCTKLEFCCNDMEEAWNEFISWGDNESFINSVNSATITMERCYPSGTLIDTMNISFCPFCGAKIEIENVKTIERT